MEPATLRYVRFAIRPAATNYFLNRASSLDWHTSLTIHPRFSSPYSCLFGVSNLSPYDYNNLNTIPFLATTFLELWKRKQSVLVWEWDLHNVDMDEENRPEFETNATTFRMNPVTREKEPYMSTWSRAIRFVITGSAVLFMVLIVSLCIAMYCIRNSDGCFSLDLRSPIGSAGHYNLPHFVGLSHLWRRRVLC